MSDGCKYENARSMSASENSLCESFTFLDIYRYLLLYLKTENGGFKAHTNTNCQKHTSSCIFTQPSLIYCRSNSKIVFRNTHNPRF